MEQRAVVDAAKAKVGARLLTVLDDEYVLRSPPPFLFYRGELRGEDWYSVAVIGTRDATDQGRSRARRLAEQLVAGGVTVVSGLARGIDTEAHTATLDAGRSHDRGRRDRRPSHLPAGERGAGGPDRRVGGGHLAVLA